MPTMKLMVTGIKGMITPATSPDTHATAVGACLHICCLFNACTVTAWCLPCATRCWHQHQPSNVRPRQVTHCSSDNDKMTFCSVCVPGTDTGLSATSILPSPLPLCCAATRPHQHAHTPVTDVPAPTRACVLLLIAMVVIIRSLGTAHHLLLTHHVHWQVSGMVARGCWWAARPLTWRRCRAVRLNTTRGVCVGLRRRRRWRPRGGCGWRGTCSRHAQVMIPLYR